MCKKMRPKLTKRKIICELEGWSPARKWGMDLLKSAIAFGFGALITVTVLYTIEDRRTEALTKLLVYWQKNYEYDLVVLEKFQSATNAYVEQGYDVLDDAMNDLTRSSSIIIKQWQDEKYDDFQLSLESVSIRFQNRYGDTEALIKDMNELANKIFFHYKNIRDTNNYETKQKSFYEGEQAAKTFEKSRRKYLEELHLFVHNSCK